MNGYGTGEKAEPVVTRDNWMEAASRFEAVRPAIKVGSPENLDRFEAALSRH